MRMKRSVLAGVLAVAALTPVAAATASAADVAGTIQPPAGEKLFLTAHATGVQIYKCNESSGAHSWGLVGPRANLYDDKDKLIGTHSVGPTWQLRDGSKVVAKKVDGVTVDPTAVQWLLLEATSTSAGDDGDRLAGTKHVQRLNTTGGLPPAASECSAEAVGTIVESPYTADYTFWKEPVS